jgi:hypothetical protein
MALGAWGGWNTEIPVSSPRARNHEAPSSGVNVSCGPTQRVSPRARSRSTRFRCGPLDRERAGGGLRQPLAGGPRQEHEEEGEPHHVPPSMRTVKGTSALTAPARS